MKRFELSVLNVIDPTKEIADFGGLVCGFLCKSEEHVLVMTEEEAKRRYLHGRWVDGKVLLQEYAEIVFMKEKFSVSRAGKRPKVVKENVMILTCPVCHMSEKIVLVGKYSPIFKWVKFYGS
jgi:hypothetical protein